MSNFHRNSNIMVHISNYMSLSRVVQAAEGLLLLLVNIKFLSLILFDIPHLWHSNRKLKLPPNTDQSGFS